jgi:competence protein ComEA
MLIFRIFALFFLLINFAQAAVNINSASESELTALPGIGPSKAAAIIEYRTTNGPFSSINDLSNVTGIGAKTVDGLRAQATTGEEGGQGGGVVGGVVPTKSIPTGTAANLIDINSANLNSLQGFNGVGPATAQKIIDYRTTNGLFSSCDDLIKVKGIGDKTLEKIKPSCTVIVETKSAPESEKKTKKSKKKSK